MTFFKLQFSNQRAKGGFSPSLDVYPARSTGSKHVIQIQFTENKMSINLCLILEYLNLRVNVRLYGFLVVSSAIIMKYLPQTNYRQMWSEIKF